MAMTKGRSSTTATGGGSIDADPARMTAVAAAASTPVSCTATMAFWSTSPTYRLSPSGVVGHMPVKLAAPGLNACTMPIAWSGLASENVGEVKLSLGSESDTVTLD